MWRLTVMAQRRPLATLGALLFVTALALGSGRGVSFDNSLDIWFLAGDPDLVEYREFQHRFNSDEVVLIGVFGDVFAPAALASIDRVTRAAEALPSVRRVRSITNIRVALADGDAVAIGPLVDGLPRDGAEADGIRRTALARPLLVDNLVARRGDSTLVVVQVEAGADNEAKTALVHALRGLVAGEHGAPLTFRLSGSPVLDDALLENSRRDAARLIPATIAVMCAVTYAAVRSAMLTVLPIVLVLIAMVWTVGFMGALGLKFNVITLSLAQLIFLIGVASTIHVLAAYLRELGAGKPPARALPDAFAAIRTPCFFTYASTCAGVLSLASSSLGPVRQFGYVGAAGIVFAFVLTLTLLPAMLRLLPPPAVRAGRHGSPGLLARLLGGLSRMGVGTARRTVAAWGAVALLSLATLPWLRVGPDPLNYFRLGDPARLDTLAVEDALGGTGSIDYVIHGKPSALSEPAVLTGVDAFQRYLESLPAVTKVFSFVDLLKELYHVLDGGADSYRVPPTRPLVSQLYLLLEGEDDFSETLQDGYAVGRGTARVRMSDSLHISRLVPAIEARFDELLGSTGARVAITGYVKMMSTMNSYVLWSQISSLGLAIPVIFVMFAILLRSVRMGLLAMIPNIPPIFVGMALMSVSGVRVDPGTVMIGSIATGLIANNTAYFLALTQAAVQAGTPLDDAVRATLREIGMPMVVSSVVLAAGFSVFAFGSFAPNVNFALVIGAVTLVGLVGDAVVLPAALLTIRPRLAGAPRLVPAPS